MTQIRFGTNGWRGVLGRDFDAAGALRLARAFARALGGRRERPAIVVAFDTRAQAAEVARAAVDAFAAAGARPLLCAAPTPTPLAGFLARARRAAGAFVVTASHNPPEYLGVKLLAPGGADLPRAQLAAIERGANAARDHGDPRTLARVLRDPPAAYLAALRAQLDARAIARARPRVLYDAMHGAGAGVLDRALRELGADVETLRGRPDPRFGGGAPDPTRARLRPLVAAMRRGGFDFGVASDGDADRFALVDARGQLLSETQALALLVDHLAARGEIARGLAISVAAGSLAARAAAAHGVRVVRVGLGFAPLSAALRAGSADIAGEESGGFAWRALGLGKDATLAAGLALEAAAREPLHARVARLERDHGSAACGRTALPATSRARAALARLAAAPPEHIGRARVVRCARDEGVRCELADGFVHWRASGTEPVIRIYAEARTHAGLRRRLAFGAARLR